MVCVFSTVHCEKALHCGHVIMFVSEGLPLPSGQFQTEDMIALGVSLAIVLLICFVVIGVLAYNLSRFNTNWKKLSEASIFRSTVSHLHK